MLSVVDKIRAERRKAKADRNKYQGVEGRMFHTASRSRYGGFGSDSYSGGRGGGSDSYGGLSDYEVYRGGSGRGSAADGSSTGAGFQDPNRQPEYDVTGR